MTELMMPGKEACILTLAHTLVLNRKAGLVPLALKAMLLRRWSFLGGISWVS